ncbi:hypothetical protein [Kaarinaea lacus]
MDKEQFFYLFANANSILNLAIRESLAGLVAESANMPEIGEEDIARAEAELSATKLEDLDLGALDGIAQGSTSADIDVGGLDSINLDMLAGIGETNTVYTECNTSEYEDQNSDISDSLFQQHQSMLDTDLKSESVSDENQSLDYDEYLQHVYGEKSLPSLIDKLFLKIDKQYLNALLAKLPNDIENLTGQLSGDDLKKWLETNDKRHETLTELFQYIRRLAIAEESGR